MHELPAAVKISTGIVGTAAGPRVEEVDARWLMAYAAALGETAPEFFDTTRPAGILTHPLFPVCYEWPLALDIRAKVLTDGIAIRGVHATHHLVIHRPPRAGDALATTAAITAVEPRTPGAYVLTRFETVDASRRPVTTTDYGSLYLGVTCEGEEVAPSPLPSPPEAEREQGAHAGKSRTPSPVGRAKDEGPDWSATVSIPANLAHVYSECARIWNPIHTDRAVALAAGLPDIILHGTANLALAVSQVLRREPPGAAGRTRRISCRFGGMVRLPSTLTVQGWGAREAGDGRAIRFRALNDEGRPAIRDGVMVLAPSP
ncbi:MAG TPA: MaoC/PaaZ C-terminal domain-containing protein [Methylomirabilota bacterium]|nr:MaoC/PaaZ C-terminal domain-containing protein [Methylomirabilota bacterium]